MGTKKSFGFTLIQLLIIVAIIVVIAFFSSFLLSAARLSANESTAIATMKNFVSVQSQFQSAGTQDADKDGIGEYGGFQQLIDAKLWSPYMLQTNAPPSIYSKSGYFFTVYRPARHDVSVESDPIKTINQSTAWSEVWTNGDDPKNVDTDGAEREYFLVCWPVSADNTGCRAFVASSSGEIYETGNSVSGGFVYSGLTCFPGAIPALLQTTKNSVEADGLTWTRRVE